MRYGLDVCTLGEYADPDRVVELASAAMAEAGVTWWLEHIHGRRDSFPKLLACVEAGPPKRDADGTTAHVHE